MSVIHEPLNERFGMKGVSIAYPYVEEANGYSKLVDDAVSFERPWNKDVKVTKSTGFRRLVYSLTGGYSGLKWGALRFRKMLGLAQGRVCFKDPFMSLAPPYIAKSLDIKVVCMVRHTAAIHYSTAKQGWDFTIENWRQQKDLIDRHGSDLQEDYWS